MSKSEITRRRQKLAQMMVNNSMVVIDSTLEKLRNNDSNYRYRQCSNLYYLTGFKDPDMIVIFTKKNNVLQSISFTKKPNKHDEIWTGSLLNVKNIKKIYQFDESYYIDSFKEKLNGLLKTVKTIYHSLDSDSAVNHILIESMKNLEKKYRSGAGCPSNISSLKKLIHKLRLIKSKTEINFIRKACKISANAHISLMKNCTPGLNERTLEAELKYFFNINEATEAYNSIVASGSNACILHYVKNESILQDGKLLLTDAGCEYEYYASDITRTIPINGKFSLYQKQVYSIVLTAQQAAIKKCVAGNTLQDIHRTAVKEITKGLISIGLLKGSLVRNINNGEYKKFYMHNTGHWMGLDVHDPSDYVEDAKPIKLKPGMIFTVEPGIYIKPSKSVDKKYHNIGIRIEDDILVTTSAPEILTKDAPKTIKDIEETMSLNYEKI